MLTQARLRDRIVQQQPPRSKVVPLLAPTKGWSSEQNLAAMEPDTAPVLQNWYPEPDGISPRPGYVVQATGLGAGAVNTLMSFVSGSAKRLFAARGGNIYRCDVAGPVGAPVWTGAGSDQWQWTNFATAGGQFISAVNGVDAPILYNGTTFATTPAITGVTGGALVNVFSSQSRLWYCQVNSADVWYLGAAAVGGAATALPLGALLVKGGAIVAGGSWATDSGSGMSDLTVFVSSEGEVLIFSGTDPAAAATWQLKGRYQIGKPLGYRSLAKFGGDLAILTQDGLMSLGAVMRLDRTAAQQGALTRNIRQAYAAAVKDDAASFGWQTIGFARGNKVFVNVPRAATGVFRQFVMNTLHGAWCEYTGIQAACFVEHNDRLYFGGTNGSVYEAERGSIDDTTVIRCNGLSAFTDLGAPNSYKIASVLRVTYRGRPDIRPYLAIAADYDLDPTFEEYELENAIGAFGTWGVSKWGQSTWGRGAGIGLSSGSLIWNQGQWNQFVWGGAVAVSDYTQSVFGAGRALAPAFRLNIYDGSPALDANFKLLRFDVSVEAGATL
ncbi:MAG: hypothetical protein J0H01_37325 [Rhizobiales bacterium]|nr:hypothetical protein [Hyphomicrobiales bacterium]